MDFLERGAAHAALPPAPERLIRAASHGLSNELFAIRAYAELALMRGDVGPGAGGDLAALITRVGEASSLLQHLSAAASAAATAPGVDGLVQLASAMKQLLPSEMACDGEAPSHRAPSREADAA